MAPLAAGLLSLFSLEHHDEMASWLTWAPSPGENWLGYDLGNGLDSLEGFEDAYRYQGGTDADIASHHHPPRVLDATASSIGGEEQHLRAGGFTAAALLTNSQAQEELPAWASFESPADAHDGIASPSAVSSGTLSTATIDSVLASTPEASLQVVQYSPAVARHKLKAGRIQKPRLRAKKQTPAGSAARPRPSRAKPVVKTDASGKVAGTETILTFGRIARAVVSSEQRSATSLTRDLGACERCHRQRKRCDKPRNMYEACPRCKILMANFYMRHAKNDPYPFCIRVSILDLPLHRKGPTIDDSLRFWVQGKQQLLLTMQNDFPTHVLYITHGFGEDLENPMSIKVSRFEPVHGDRTAYFWTDPSSGELRSMEMAPYFISDLEAAGQNLREFARRSRSAYIDALVADSNPIVQQAFQTALELAAFGKNELISDALDLWVAARFIETQWRIFRGGDLIGLQPTSEPKHPFDGFTAVTPIMDTQLDDLAIRELIAPLANRLLRRLNDKIEERKRENWLELHIAMVILMSNAGLTLKDLTSHARWKGLKPGNRGGTLTQGFIHACKTLLSHFHFACAGSIPLSIDFADPSAASRNYSGMTRGQIEYICNIQQEIARQESVLSRWTELSMYNDELYWFYQVIVQNWRGDVLHPGEIDDFREEDLLSSSRT